MKRGYETDKVYLLDISFMRVKGRSIYNVYTYREVWLTKIYLMDILCGIMVKILVGLSDDLLGQVDKECKEGHFNRSEFIRQAVREKLGIDKMGGLVTKSDIQLKGTALQELLKTLEKDQKEERKHVPSVFPRICPEHGGQSLAGVYLCCNKKVQEEVNV